MVNHKAKLINNSRNIDEIDLKKGFKKVSLKESINLWLKTLFENGGVNRGYEVYNYKETDEILKTKINQKNELKLKQLLKSTSSMALFKVLKEMILKGMEKDLDSLQLEDGIFNYLAPKNVLKNTSVKEVYEYKTPIITPKFEVFNYALENDNDVMVFTYKDDMLHSFVENVVKTFDNKKLKGRSKPQEPFYVRMEEIMKEQGYSLVFPIDNYCEVVEHKMENGEVKKTYIYHVYTKSLDETFLTGLEFSLKEELRKHKDLLDNIHPIDFLDGLHFALTNYVGDALALIKKGQKELLKDILNKTLDAL